MVCAVNKIDSNITGLAYAEEECLKELPVTPVWKALEPNSYSDFGGDISTVARAPINPSRQRKKGTITDLDASGGFNSDFTKTNLNDLLQGFFFADTRVRAEASNPTGVAIAAAVITITAGGLVSIDAAELEALVPALLPGEWFYFSGPGATTKGFCRVDSITGGLIVIGDTTMTLAPGSAAVNGAAVAYVGNTLRNEQTPSLIKRRSYQLERQLGNDGVGIQSEYLIGAVANELTLNIPQADKLNVDLSFVACDDVFRTGTEGIKTGTRQAAPGEDAYNTTLNISRVKLAVIDPLDSNPTSTFGFVSDASISIQNNATPNKAIGVLGAFDISVGDFVAGGNVTAYFSTVAGVQAVRNNADFCFNVIGAFDNAGFIFDVPLCGLAGSRVTVTKDEPITIPLEPAGAENKYGYTMSYTYFPVLPAEAMPA